MEKKGVMYARKCSMGKVIIMGAMIVKKWLESTTTSSCASTEFDKDVKLSANSWRRSYGNTLQLQISSFTLPARQKEKKEKNMKMISRQKHRLSYSVSQINQFEKALKSAEKTSWCYLVERQKMLKKYAREKKSG